MLDAKSDIAEYAGSGACFLLCRYLQRIPENLRLKYFWNRPDTDDRNNSVKRGRR